MVWNYDGKNSEHRFMVSKLCPFCKKTGAYYLGSEVMYRGHSVPGGANDALHYFVCARGDCQREWSERK